MTLHIVKQTDDKWLRQEWETPQELFEQLNVEFGFTVDAAARSENAKLSEFWTQQESGLSKSWKGQRVWCNPPYADIKPWLVKGWQEIKNNSCQLAVFLVPASFDVDWFDMASLGEINVFKGRVQFEEPPELKQMRESEGKKKKGGASGGVMLVVYRPETLTDWISYPLCVRIRSAKTGKLLAGERLVKI